MNAEEFINMVIERVVEESYDSGYYANVENHKVKGMSDEDFKSDKYA